MRFLTLGDNGFCLLVGSLALRRGDETLFLDDDLAFLDGEL
jgi:hypothetical protein